MKKSCFKTAYIIFISILLLLSVISILYIWNLLVKFEASQPEREVEKQIKLLKDAAAGGSLTDMLSFDNYKPESDEVYKKEISDYTDKIKNTDLTYESQRGFDASGYVYNIKSGTETLAKVKLESISAKTKLIVFNFQKWKVASLEPAVLNKSFDLPSALTLKINGENVNGTIDNTTGTVTYKVCSLTTPEITIYDVSGDKVIYDPQNTAKTYNYTVSIPSNYTLYANNSKVDPKVAQSTPVSEYEYVSKYFDAMPTQLTYNLYFLSNGIEFKITDNLGQDVSFEMEKRKITLEGQAGQSKVPESVSSQVDILNYAKQWSLFMTQDIAGANNGYATIKKMLIDGSYLQSVAWKWATGIDITFTSIHKLANPPFIDEEISNFVSYGENCFSCTVKFKKHMILSTGMEVKDPMDSTLYFVKYDDTKDNKDNPRWLLADIRENVNQGGK